VTNESPDYQVTQGRGEFFEPETKTSNVASFARSEEEEPALEPAPVATPPPSPRREEAVLLFKRLLRNGVRFDLADGDRVAWKANPGFFMGEHDEGRLRELMPEIAALIMASPVEPPAPIAKAPGPLPAAPGAIKAAAPVPAPVRSEILAKIGQLSEDVPGQEDFALLASAMVRALGPHEDHDRTNATFLGLVSDVRRGRLPVACLIEAFKEACGSKKHNRGAAFIQAVKRWKKASNHARERSRA
jgi:hypothetical protein